MSDCQRCTCPDEYVCVTKTKPPFRLEIPNRQNMDDVGMIFIPSLLLLLAIPFIVIRANRLYRRNRIPDFERKRVFVTGTDTGFGRELVLKMDRKGVTVYAGCYTTDGGRRLRADTSNRVRIVYIDVANRETLEVARQFVEEDLPEDEGLWGIVNNAGILRGLLFDFCVEDDFRQTMEVNFFGCLRTVEVFLPLIKRTRGRIVNVVSAAGRCSLGSEPYTCSKHALEPYCDGLRRAMKKFGVHVSIVEPGFHRTNINSERTWRRELDRTWHRMPDEVKREYGDEFINGVRKCADKIIEKMVMRSSNKLDNVSRAIVHALLSQRPKDRYIIGLDAHLLMIIGSLAPDWLLDKMDALSLASKR